MMKSFFLSCFLFFSFFTYAQSDSCFLQVSLLTCGPGEDLYSAFGHTALRIKENNTGRDIVYNYGTFDDSDPLFYLKFTKGIMVYSLSAEYFSDFMQEYLYEQRSVTEQIVQLSCEEKHTLLMALQLNLMPVNRYYNYYFLSDNCTTRPKDMIVKNTGNTIHFNSIFNNTPPTYRQMLLNYLDKSGKPWTKFGMDILLGSKLDVRVNNENGMFLPDYLLNGFDSAQISHQPLVSEKRILLPAVNKDEKVPWLTPALFFSIILLIITLLSFAKTNRTLSILKIVDIVFFSLLGLIGILIAILWAIRIDTTFRNNYNLLIALPTHLPLAFLLLAKRRWVKAYFKAVAVLSLLLLAGWYFLPQQLNVALIPVALIAIIRSWQISQNK